ncbi:hypothetical protein D4T97_011130 [Siminovitchia acidinfaciens]|uniref:Uncharacterized protein n=1 Tax=Siminovitchia acidinfaciens TaxID=2321395 RepID=A0A429XZL6_9BACI|nr:hypothetical protein [Siminovitchia acidinfaciens]RST74220.1 hypothetical protein D4T97_011130 [Siminovitchia acidinfaciens]
MQITNHNKAVIKAFTSLKGGPDHSEIEEWVNNWNYVNRYGLRVGWGQRSSTIPEYYRVLRVASGRFL